MQSNLEVENGTVRRIEMILSPWLGSIYQLDPGDVATMTYQLPEDAWVEAESTGTAVFLHFWPEMSCGIRMTRASGEALVFSLPPTTHGASMDARPPELRRWAAQHADSAVRLLVTRSAEADISGQADRDEDRPSFFHQVPGLAAGVGTARLTLTKAGFHVSGDGLEHTDLPD